MHAQPSSEARDIHFDLILYPLCYFVPARSKGAGNMHRSRKFCQSGSNFEVFFFKFCFCFVVVFFVDEGREDPNATISGPSSALQQNAI